MNPAPTLFQTRVGRKERIAPSLILPDSFFIEYLDGTREMLYSRILITPNDYEGVTTLSSKSSGGSLAINITGIEKQANEPSCLHRNFLLGIGKATKRASSSSSSRRLDEKVALNDIVSIESRQNHGDGGNALEALCNVHEDGWFTKAYNCSGFAPPYDDDGPLEVAYKVMEDGYILFKLDSFDAPPDIILPLWREINVAASEVGVDRLMIDISNNGGGEVPMGLNLARLMYPDISCDMFDNKYDMVYNEPMRIWAQVIQPLLDEIEHEWFHVLTENDKLKTMMGMTAEQQGEITDISKAMCTLDLDHDADFCGAVRTARKNCTLYISAKMLQRMPSLQSFSGFVQELFAYMKKSNPWTVASEFDARMSSKERASFRGGVLANFTSFLEHEPDYPTWWNCSPIREMNVFSEYILISNGNSGSTANTFQTTVEQMWKNRGISGAMRPLTTVSYGGIPNDTPLTQFAGGTVDDRVNVEDPFVGLAGLRLLASFSHGSSKGRHLKEAFDLLRASLPEVPYYLQQFPRLPAVEIYNKFMLSDGAAMPLEFVFMPPDVYIPETFYGGVFDDPAGLAGLYREASFHFHRRR
jgi:hypothetical protein